MCVCGGRETKEGAWHYQNKCILDVFFKIEVGDRMAIEDVGSGHNRTYMKRRQNKIEINFFKNIGRISKSS